VLPQPHTTMPAPINTGAAYEKRAASERKPSIPDDVRIDPSSCQSGATDLRAFELAGDAEEHVHEQRLTNPSR
jgi:hypothetical protein